MNPVRVAIRQREDLMFVIHFTFSISVYDDFIYSLLIGNNPDRAVLLFSLFQRETTLDRYHCVGSRASSPTSSPNDSTQNSER
ncbi:hypothetical protein BDR04DRAFT_1098995 [Suillus decipiens]|nr:hypothetical protein BDR04DRAFT_1098995 [Suillus decipiens]